MTGRISQGMVSQGPGRRCWMAQGRARPHGAHLAVHLHFLSRHVLCQGLVGSRAAQHACTGDKGHTALSSRWKGRVHFSCPQAKALTSKKRH